MNIILFEKGTRQFLSSDDRYIHIKKVLKLKLNDSFKAGEINGFSGKALITNFDEKQLSFTFEKENDESFLHPITLILAMVRPICMKRILREVVSMGIKRLILTCSDLGEKSYVNSSLYQSDEYKSIMINGAMQGGKTGVSEIVFTSNIQEAISLVDTDQKYLLDNKIGALRFKDIELNNDEIVLAIGAERGFSDKEREIFTVNNFKSILLGDRILRTETAVVASVALAIEKRG